MEGEAENIVHHGDSGNNKKQIKILRVWQFLTAIFVVLFLVSILTSGFRVNAGKGLSVEEISVKTEKYINDNILRGQAIASVKDVKEASGLYLLTIEIGSQMLESYATKDGVLLLPQAINLNEAQDADAPEGASASVKLEVGDAPVKGVEDAPLTIIEFSDLSCPFCGAAVGKNPDSIKYLKGRDPSWEAPLPGIIKNYVDTGKAKLVFKYFPGHGTGEGAMKLAWCSGEQGKFWEVHDAFFENQDAIEDAEKLKVLAAGAGIDRAKLEECYESGRYDGRLASEANEGRTAGVSGTPTFFINGKRVSGAQSFQAVKQVIEAELVKNHPSETGGMLNTELVSGGS